jgi:DNA-binding transcriptional LysR family regulator
MHSANLEYFRLAVEAGSLTRAAGLHGVRVSTLARAINKLEDEFGVTLLERSHAGVRLTVAGDLLFQRIVTLLDDLDEVRTLCQMLGAGRRGIVRIGTLLPPVGVQFRLALSVWKSKNPDIRVIFYEMGTCDLRSALFRRRVDVIFSTPFAKSEAIETLPFCSESLMVALSSEHSLHRYQSITPGQLQNEIFLVQDWGRNHSVRDHYTKILGTDVTIETHPAGKQSVFALVSAGYGMTLAVQSQAERGFPGVIFRPLRERDAHLPIRLGWDADRQDAVTGRFVAFIRDFVRQR